MSRILLASALLSLLFVASTADTFAAGRVHGRSLLQKKEKGGAAKGQTKNTEKGGATKTSKAEAKAAKAEERRVAEALAQFEKEQKKREKEKQEVLKRANKEADVELTKFGNSLSEEDQIEVFVKLWRNARGPTILVLLTKLIASSKSSADSYTQVVADSMLEAQRKGYSFPIADGLSAALTLVENEEDGEPLLDAIVLNMKAKNNGKKGSGCTYVKNLFTDAEVIAKDSGYEMEFTQAFDAQKYLILSECFYPACEKAALACCKDKNAGETGRCDCDKKEPNMCAFNLFLNEPRPIWKCNDESCKVEKCLCPFIKQKKANGKGQGKGKGKGKPKGQGKGKPKGKGAKRT